MDRSWMQLPNRFSDEYIDGVRNFLGFAYVGKDPRTAIRCPCVQCNNYYRLSREEVQGHLLIKGIVKSYTRWIHHGEPYEPHNDDDDDILQMGDEEHEEEDTGQDDMEGMLHDIFTESNTCDAFSEEFISQGPQIPEGEGDKFSRLVRDAKQELYPGCGRTSKLSFIVHLMHMKMIHNWSNKSVDTLLDFLRNIFPSGNQVPKSFYEAKKVVRDLGLNYEKIDACKNDCVIFWGPNKERQTCPTCGESRWVSEKPNGTKIPHKVLRHFPLKPRLQRLFMNKDIAAEMRWHKEKRVEEANVLRHPADGQAWKDFDMIHELFSDDPRNVRLGLASDGINPFSNLSSTHSTWPVIIVPYNLPPWKYMKDPFFMLSLLIPGPKAPGNDIDVFLQPLIKELKELWEDGIQTYDAFTQSMFQLRAAILWTINDFPAYANLSGWSTKGKIACPVCNEDTCSMRLFHGKKTCYMGHRRFLPSDHKWRENKSSFNGRKEHGVQPKWLSGDDVLRQLERVRPTIFGKSSLGKRKRDAYELNWTKHSIFFELPYWKTLKLRHNLDVMHIEKNVSENILGTLLNIDGKTKDTIKSRFDLKEMGIRRDLHPYKKGEKWVMPQASYTLSREEKRSLCEFWRSLKLPDGYASNISRCVNAKEGKISGMKSHDHHVFLQRLLPLAIRGYLKREVCQPLIELGSFFKELCSKTLRIDNLERLQSKLALTLCNLERIFPPSFFDVMVHLPIHLAHEAILGGPVQSRWMYPFERYMRPLKLSVRNKACPEGSIAEHHIHKECLTFCSMYLHGIETKFNRPDRNDDRGEGGEGISVFSSNGRPIGKANFERLTHSEWHKAHLYVLDNCEETEKYVKKHKVLLEKSSRLNLEKRHAEGFPKWFENHMAEKERKRPGSVSKQLSALAVGPSYRVHHYKGCIINGYRFHIRDHDKFRKTQNSGIVVVGEHEQKEIDFYGEIYDIIQLDYGASQTILFKCDWWNLGRHKGAYGIRSDEYGFVSVNTAETWYSDLPFVLAYQAEQVFYVPDLKLGNDWKVVVKNTPRDKYDFPEESLDEELLDEDEPYQQQETNNIVRDISEVDDFDPALRRDDIPALEFDARTVEKGLKRTTNCNFINNTIEEDEEEEEEEEFVDSEDEEAEDTTISEEDDSESDNLYC